MISSSQIRLLNTTAAIVMAGWAGSVFAQDSDPKNEEVWQREAIGDKTNIQEVGGPLDEPGVSARSGGGLFRLPSLQLQAEDGSANAVVATGIDLVGSRKAKSGDYNIVSRTRFDVKAQVPFDQIEGRDNFFDFKGIEGGESITFGFNYLQTKSYSNLTQIDVDRRLLALSKCVTANADKWAAVNWPTLGTDGVQALKQKYINAFESLDQGKRFFNERETSKWNEQNGEAGKSLSDLVIKACDAPSGEDLIATYIGTTEAEAYKAAFFGDNPKGLIWNFGAESTATFSDADFLDRDAFLIVQDNRTEWDVSAYLGATSLDGNTSFKLTGSYTSSLDFPDEAEVCQMNMDGTQDCIMGPDGRPELEEDAFVSATVRHRLSKNGVAKNLAVAPVVTYNVDEDEWFFELPIYFQTNEKGALDAGLRVGYETGENDFGVGVFVGVPF